MRLSFETGLKLRRGVLADSVGGCNTSLSQRHPQELVEALTDSKGDGAQVDPTNATDWHEIGDVCSSRGAANGVTLQCCWSQQA